MDLEVGWPRPGMTFSQGSDALSLDGAPGTVGHATAITARTWFLLRERFSSPGRRTLFWLFLVPEIENFFFFSSGTNPQRFYVSSLPPIRTVQGEDRKVLWRGPWSRVLLQNLPRAVASAWVTEGGQNTRHRASGQLCKALSQEEIPSSPQLVNSYALEPRTDMPCNCLT